MSTTKLHPSNVVTETEKEVKFDLTNMPFPSIFNRFDLIVFLLAFIGIGFYVKSHHRLDIFQASWNFIKPHYDEGVDDYWATTPPSKEDSGSLMGEL